MICSHPCLKKTHYFRDDVESFKSNVWRINTYCTCVQYFDIGRYIQICYMIKISLFCQSNVLSRFNARLNFICISNLIFIRIKRYLWFEIWYNQKCSLLYACASCIKKIIPFISNLAVQRQPGTVTIFWNFVNTTLDFAKGH